MFASPSDTCGGNLQGKIEVSYSLDRWCLVSPVRTQNHLVQSACLVDSLCPSFIFIMPPYIAWVLEDDWGGNTTNSSVHGSWITPCIWSVLMYVRLDHATIGAQRVVFASSRSSSQNPRQTARPIDRLSFDMSSGTGPSRILTSPWIRTHSRKDSTHLSKLSFDPEKRGGRSRGSSSFKG